MRRPPTDSPNAHDGHIFAFCDPPDPRNRRINAFQPSGKGVGGSRNASHRLHLRGSITPQRGSNNEVNPGTGEVMRFRSVPCPPGRVSGVNRPFPSLRNPCRGSRGQILTSLLRCRGFRGRLEGWICDPDPHGERCHHIWHGFAGFWGLLVLCPRRMSLRPNMKGSSPVDYSFIAVYHFVVHFISNGGPLACKRIQRVVGKIQRAVFFRPRRRASQSERSQPHVASVFCGRWK